MKITVEADPLADYGYDRTMSVDDVMDFLKVSDGTARKFLKENDLYLKVGGAVRVPRLALSRVLFERGETPENSEGNIVEVRKDCEK